MADSLNFKGQKTVTNQTGAEMILARPKRGGDTFQIKKWWGGRANTVYLTCAKFIVGTNNGDIELIVPVEQEDVEVKIVHNGDGNFSFTEIRGIDRIGVFESGTGALIKEYLIPSNITLPIQEIGGSGSLPPAISIGTVTVAPASSDVAVGDTVNYSCFISGNASDAVYSYSTTGNTTITGSGPNVQITFNSAESVIVTCTVTSQSATDSGATGTATATVTVTFASRVAAATSSYVVTVADGVYQIDGVAQAAITGNAGDTLHFDLSDASLSGHPFKIYTDASKTTEVTVGIEQVGTDLLFIPPIAGSFSYQCSNHAAMGGDLTIS